MTSQAKLKQLNTIYDIVKKQNASALLTVTQDHVDQLSAII